MRTKLLSLVALLIVAGAAISVYAVDTGIITIDSNAESLQLVTKSIQDQPSCPDCYSNIITLELKNTGSTEVTIVKYVLIAGSNQGKDVPYSPPTLTSGQVENVTILPTIGGSGAGDGSWTVDFTTQRGHIFSWGFTLANCSNGGCTIS